MSDLIQLVYASRARVSRADGQSGIETDVARILTQSRRNNAPRSIGGVLCYGDGFFFQCLEGQREAVEALYETIRRDTRHSDVTLLKTRPVVERQFRLWAMKYLTVDREVRDELRREGLSEFNPYHFGEQTIERMLSVLRASTERRLPSGSRPDAEVPVAAVGALPLPALAAAFGMVVATLTVAGLFLFGGS